MKEQLGIRIQQRIEMLYRYTNAMESGDTDLIAVVLEQAQHDSVLERMILEVNEVYQIEDRTVAHPDDIATAQEMLLTTFAVLKNDLDTADTPAAAGIPNDAEIVGTGLVPVREMVPHTHQTDHNEPSLRLRTTTTPTIRNGKTIPTNKWYRSRTNWLISAVAAILIILLLVPSAGALANQFLSLFRVQQFQPVSTVERPDQLMHDVAYLLRNFGTIQWDYSDSNQSILSPVTSNNLADVEKLIDFHPQLPTTLPDGVGSVVQYSVSSRQSAAFVFDRAKAEAYLQQTGQSSVTIPSSLSGAKFNVELSKGLAVIYYDHCQAPAPDGTQDCTSGKVSLALGEIPSPVINAEGNASFSDLRAFLLALPKLSPDLHNLIEHTDVKSGLVPVPIPSDANAQQVKIKGAQGLVLSYAKADLIVWQNNGLVYLITAYGSDTDQLLNTANSFHTPNV